MSNEFLSPMQPWPGLEKYARTVTLPESNLSLFLYEAGEFSSSNVILLHGLGDEADTWRYLIEPLAIDYHVIAPDLPGFGRSGSPPVEFTMPFLCNVILELFDLLSIPKAILIGNSLGAVIAQTLALNHPERLKGLILIDGTLLAKGQKLGLHSLLFLLPGLGKWMYNRLRKDPQAAYDTLRPYYYDLDRFPQVERDFLYLRVNQRVWSDSQRDAYLSVLRNMTSFVMRQQRGISDRLAQLTTPSLIIWGEEDQLFPVETARILTKYQSGARLVTLAQTGHLPHQERPDKVIEAILSDERFNSASNKNGFLDLE